MCGIVAIKWTSLPPAFSIVDQSIEMLCDRGKDAWGIAIGANDSPSDTIVVKDSSRIDIRKNKKAIHKLLHEIRSSGWLLLHSRLATNGFSGLSDHNHPIELENILLVHNGLVVEWPIQAKQFTNESNTDSQNLASVIASTERRDLEGILNQTVGEISVIWHNNGDNTLNAYTNVGGLYLETNNEHTIVSSEQIQSNSQSRRVERRKIIKL
jgi:glucosamine 6-phosphate synthetase-like amidotransferase/phosphosugar isomerase protein